MPTQFNKLLASAAASLVLAGASYAAPSPSVIEFGLDDTLFVADSASATIYAYDLPDDDRGKTGDAAYNLLNIDALIEAETGADPGTIQYLDLAVHPVTRDAYVSLSYTRASEALGSIVTIRRDGSVAVLNLSELPSSSYHVDNPADENVTFWRDIPAPSLSITDLDFTRGEIFVSGISTGEFASTLRRVPYPFDGTASATSVEMYHAAHGQNETRAPIRAMAVVDLDGEQVVVAAYTCTPLVTVETEKLKDGEHVTGKTIAELGYGNTPLDVIGFSSANMEGDVDSYLLVVNREMGADLISFDALREAHTGEGINKPVPYLGAVDGVATTTLPLSGVIQAADQDNQYILAMRRNIDNGNMELVSFRKGAFFRLSDFISEYNFPDYEYGDDQFAQGTRMFQNMLKTDEGFPDQVR